MRYLLVSLFIFSVISCSDKKAAKQDLIGKWTIADAVYITGKPVFEGGLEAELYQQMMKAEKGLWENSSGKHLLFNADSTFVSEMQIGTKCYWAFDEKQSKIKFTYPDQEAPNEEISEVTFKGDTLVMKSNLNFTNDSLKIKLVKWQK